MTIRDHKVGEVIASHGPGLFSVRIDDDDAWAILSLDPGLLSVSATPQEPAEASLSEILDTELARLIERTNNA